MIDPYSCAVQLISFAQWRGNLPALDRRLGILAGTGLWYSNMADEGLKEPIVAILKTFKRRRGLLNYRSK